MRSRLIAQIERVWKNKFVRNVVVVASGTAGAQAITMAFVPIITRLYGPESFGLLGTFSALLAIVAPISAFTFPIAIVLPKSDRDAVGLMKLSIGLALVFVSVLALLIVFLGDWFADLLGIQSIASFLLLIPVAMLFSACHQIIQQWLIRKKQFKITARVAVYQAMTVNSAKAGVGWLYPSGGMLIVIATLGHGLHAILLFLGLYRNPNARPQFNRSLKWKDIGVLGMRHKDFFLFRAPQTCINALSQSLPVLLLAGFFGSAAAGYYVLSKTVMSVPITLISKSVGDVFYPRISEASHNNENLYKLLLKSTVVLAVVGAIPFSLVVFFGPLLFSFIFGPEWVVAGEYARWIAVWLFFAFLNKPSVVSLPVFGMLNFFLIYEIFSIFARILAIYIGLVLFSDGAMAVAAFSVAGALLNFYLIIHVLVKSRAEDVSIASS